MTPFELQFKDLQASLKAPGCVADFHALPSGAFLVEVRNYPLPAGWSESSITILFVAPPGYPSARPDCFWVEPTRIRLVGGVTPQGSNDANQIPEVGQRGTWFSWHLQEWNPNRDSLVSYFNAIRARLDPPR
jgi:hypothetical protein